MIASYLLTDINPQQLADKNTIDNQKNNYKEHEPSKNQEKVNFLLTDDAHNTRTAKLHSVFLKYMKINEKFINAPEQFEKLVKQMVNELNSTGIKKSTSDWLVYMNDWKTRVKKEFNYHKYNIKKMKFTTEDLELISLLKDENAVSEPTQSQLSCMLDHLEIAGYSTKLWTTICLEMEALGGQGRNEEYWQKAFERWIAKVKRKKKILNQWDSDNSCTKKKPNTLTNLETRLLDFLMNQKSDISNIPTNIESDIIYPNNCRVCLGVTPVMIYIFNEEEIMESDSNPTLAEKINCCASITPVSKDDGFPQSICQTCADLVESAYRFKSICERADLELRNIARENIKLESTEYLNSSNVFGDSGDYEVIEFSNFVDNDDDENEERIDDFNETGKLTDKQSEIDDISSEEMNIKKRSLRSKRSTTNKSRIEARSSAASSNNLHQCETCGIFCKNIAALKIHIKTHSNLKPHQCNDCGKDFKTRLSLKIHIRSHTGERPYVCEVCGKSFTQEGSLNYHRSIHTGEKKYECMTCGYRARSINDLNIHTRKHTGHRPYQCAVCKYRFTTSSNLQKHLRRHTGQKNYQTCGKAFKTCSAVNNHRAIHSGVKDFKCPHCPYRACTKANLKIHDRTHSGVQPYSCRFCQIKFSTASNMHKHIRNIHEKLKTHKCDQCGRSFFSRESARKHMVTHTGLKPYSCAECPMSYGWYNGLQKHMRLHHPGNKMPTEKSFFDLLPK